MSDLSFLCRAAIAAAAGAWLVFGSPDASAQSMTDPAAFEFRASADHGATNGSGVPVLSQYEAQFFLPGAVQPFQTVPLGKPTPDASGLIRVAFANLSARPSPGIVSEVRVAALGPGGAAASGPSGTFTFTPPSGPPPPTTCTYTVSPSAPSLGAAETPGSLAVNTAAGCAWSATGSSSWITITATSGSGSGWVSYRVAANTGSAARIGTIVVAGQPIPITQAGAGGVSPTCTVTVPVTTTSIPQAGASGSLDVSAPSSCTWTATSSADWLTITATTGHGTGWVSYRAGANLTPQARTTVIRVADKTVTLTQAAIATTADAPTAPNGFRLLKP